MRGLLLLLLLWCLPAAAFSQAAPEADDDGGFLTRMIERQLSSDSQSVHLSGFQGVLSSRASFQRLTIADAQGVWLTIEDAALDWNRAALLKGQLQVTDLSAARIDLERLPPGGGSGGFSLPSPTSTEISLPTLPVDLSVGHIGARAIRLGPDVLGQEVTATLDGSLQLAGGSGAARITAQRTDGVRGVFDLDAAYRAETRGLKLKLQLDEAAGGLLAHALGLPGAPAVTFSIDGDAPIGDFTAAIELATDGTPRLDGALHFTDLAGGAGLGWGLELSGDLQPLFKPAYQPFFGVATELAVAGQSLAGGGMRLESVRISSEQVQLSGSLDLGADGMPTRFDLSGALKPAPGDTVLLPLAGAETRVGALKLAARFDAASGDAFRADLSLADLARGGTAIGAATLSARGHIRSGDSRRVTADIVAGMEGLAVADPAMTQAIGGQLAGTLVIDWVEGQPLALRNVDLSAGDTHVFGAASLAGVGDKLKVTLDATLLGDDLARFSALAGQPLSGAARASVQGYYEPMGGGFDLTFDAVTKALDMGGGLLARLTGGDGSFNGRVARGAEGTTFDDLKVQTSQLAGTFAGSIGPNSGKLQLDAQLTDFAQVYPALPGPAKVTGTLARTGEALSFDLVTSLPQQIALALSGTGAADLSTLQATIDGRIPDIAPLVPQVSGPFTAKGTVGLDTGRLQVDLATDGPQGAALQLSGSYGLKDGRADLAVRGSADLAMVEHFTDGALRMAGTAGLDLALRGPLALGSVSGNLSAPNVRIDLPRAGVAVADADLSVALQPARDDSAGPIAAARVSAALAGIEAEGASWPALLAGPVTLQGEVALLPQARLQLRALQLANGDASLSGEATLALAERTTSADLHLALADLSRLQALAGVALGGALAADVRGNYDLKSSALDAQVVAETRNLVVAGNPAFAVLDPRTTLSARVQLANDQLSLMGIDLANGDVRLTGEAQVAGLSAGPQVTAQVAATVGTLGRFSSLIGLPLAGGAELAATVDYNRAASALQASLDGRVSGLRVDAGPAAVLLAGDARLGGKLEWRSGSLTVSGARFTSGALDLRADYSAPVARVQARLDSLGRFVPGLNGPVTASGAVTVRDGYGVDLTVAGPAGIAARVTGNVTAALVPDLRIDAKAPLGLANLVAGKAVNVQGAATARLTLTRTLGLDGLGGTVTLANGAISTPFSTTTAEGLSGQITFAGSRARVEVETGFNTSGRAGLSGEIGLAGAQPVALTLSLNRVEVVQQPTLRTTLNGSLQLNGTLTGGGTLAGHVNLAETDISLNFGVGGGTLINVIHLAEPPGSRATRQRADLLGESRASGAGSGGRLALDVTVAAPQRIFVRGRGLDAELGGQIRLTGRAGAVVPVGAFELIRGRFDLLGRRLDLTRGELQLQGDADPTVHLEASSLADGVTVLVLVDGTASAPKISFSSSPEMPQEEALALLLFGKRLDSISPLQALQLANAVRTLVQGGEGIQGRLRQKFGLDDLDLDTDENGNVAVRAGTYLSRNVYVDTAINAAGDVDVQLNLDITPNLKARGAVDSDGDTRLGIYYERDY